MDRKKYGQFTISAVDLVAKKIYYEKLRIKRLHKNLTPLKRAFANLYFYQKPYLIPTPSSPEKYIFTANINYFAAGKESIWGGGDRATLEYLNSLSLSQNWLNVAAGDGRYNNLLLTKAKEVVANDVDRGALSKLWYLTPQRLRPKLSISVFNITDQFPYPPQYFSGVFCTGVLHLFPPKILLNHVFPEFERVITKRGRIIFDFSTDIKRVYPDGRRAAYGDEPAYEFSEALAIVQKYFANYQTKVVESSVSDDLTKTPGVGYHFSCRFFLLDARRK